jgi:hypothetical protein
MASSSKNNDEFLTMQILETPAGRQVIEVFVKELFTTWDIGRSVDRAKEAAKKNGTLLPLQITLVADFLIRVLGPVIIEQLRSHKK